MVPSKDRRRRNYMKNKTSACFARDSLLTAIRAPACAIMLLLFMASAQAADQHMLSSDAHAAVAKLTPLGRLPAAIRLNLVIGLPLRNQIELTNLFQQLYDPTSANFHRFLTPKEFTARFGPTEADYE